MAKIADVCHIAKMTGLIMSEDTIRNALNRGIHTNFNIRFFL
jgi:hypothetical protein